MSAPPQPVVIQVVQTHRGLYDNYHTKGARICGYLQISLAIASMLLSIASILMHIEISYQGYGISSGIFWVITGAFGVVSARRKTACTIITTLVLSVLCATGIASYLSLAATQIVMVAETQKDHDYDSYEHDMSDSEKHEDGDGGCYGSKMAVSSLLLIVGLTELIVSITQASLCCKVACCCRKHNQPVQNGGSSAQYMIVNTGNGQQAVSLPPNYQVVPPVDDGDMKKLIPSDAPEYTAAPPPAYTT